MLEWYEERQEREIPQLVLSKFLKLTYELHEIQGTLDLEDLNTDGRLDITDLGVVITHLIRRMSTGAQPVAKRTPAKRDPSH